LTGKLDYLQRLGVTCLWLLPFCESPLRDDGYDVAHYERIHPDYGTCDDFVRFLDAAHARGLRVITELVINHTSDEHPRFRAARRAPKGSPKRDFYVWSDTDQRYRGARVIFADVETSNWAWDPVAGAYYWHRFFDHQPDLNFDNPRVRRAVLKVVRFWFDLGVDGLRLDVISHLYEREGTSCDNLPETHQFLKEVRADVDRRYPGRVLLAEANDRPEVVRAYFGDGDECTMAFHFPLMPRLFMALATEDATPIVDIINQTQPLPDDAQWAIFLRNHDELSLSALTKPERRARLAVYAPEPRMRLNHGIRRRLAPLLGNDPERLVLAHALLLSLPGSPPADLVLPVVADATYGPAAVNVAAQERESTSLLARVTSRLQARRQHQAFGRGASAFLRCDNPKVLAFERSYRDAVDRSMLPPIGSTRTDSPLRRRSVSGSSGPRRRR
jgi:maltose alpha-D-glucosyltransferase/alpha-amylase